MTQNVQPWRPPHPARSAGARAGGHAGRGRARAGGANALQLAAGIRARGSTGGVRSTT